MHKNARRRILFIAGIALTLGLAGCDTFFFAVRSPESGNRSERPKKPERHVALYQKGQVVEIRGRIVVKKNQVMFEDQDSSAVFRFVGLRPEERRDLSNRAGELIRVMLRVVSTQSARYYNARFIHSRHSGIGARWSSS
jgi:hypothetical protein